MKLLFLSLLAVVLISSASAQTINVKKLNRLRVPEQLKARLIERLNLFVKYELLQQYDKQFDLLAIKCPEYLPCFTVEKQEYVRQKSEQMKIYGTLLELEFTEVSEKKLKDNCVGIGLSPKLRDKNKVYYNASSSIACLQDNDWFFRFAFIEI